MIGLPEALRLIASEAALLIDVRDPAEVAATGKLRLAVNIPAAALARLGAEPAIRKSRPILLCCACGGCSRVAAVRLRALGYTRVHNLGALQAAVDGGLSVAPAGYSAGSFRGSSTAALA